MICDRCGATVDIGMWPFCHGNPINHVQQSGGIVRDEMPGGFVQEHFGHAPETFYSKQAMLKRADQLHLRPMVRHVEGDQHVARMVTTDPYTLAAAAALVTRGSAASPAPDEIPCETAQFAVVAR